ncbi:Arylsulfatase A [Nonomuraea pusilla]|uniref:Arylsulfatase A n=1 Tax=Nonomuraea pusilla TaxID=46177 RepID=A0A1H8F7W9_9ACTN|nr:Arylsulfatase A [Nonomuraea pusilla]
MLPCVINGPSRRAFLAGTLAGISVPPTGAAAAATPTPGARAGLPSRPNVVVVLADDLGWGEIGSQGQRLARTPTLDRLAAEGVRFETAYSGAPLCAPSRCALLTGLHAGHGTVRENPEGGPQRSLTSADVTFAELLQLAGYRTACIGKWGFGPEEPGQPSHPNERGFGEFFGYIGHKHAHEYYPRYLWHNGERVELGGRAYAPDLFRRRAQKFIRRRADEPFLLYFASNLPHAPSVVPGDAGRYEHEPWTRANRRHAAQVSRLDADVAALVRTLRETGAAERTLLLFTSDNGPHHEKGVTPELFDANGPWRGVKRQLYEGGIRVPFIAWSPRLRPRVETQPVASWDVLPTLADLAGVPAPAHLDGRSFRGLLTGEGAPAHDHLVWNRPRKMQAIRRGRWKAIRFAPHIAGAGPRGRVELYDLDADPGERRNLAALRPALAADLVARLDRSIGPDPRLPYGMELAVADGRLTVTLRNGSAVSWRDVELSVGGARPASAPAGTLAPGEETSAVFPLAGADPAGVTARAVFRTSRGRHVFRRRRRAGAAASGDGTAATR